MMSIRAGSARLGPHFGVLSRQRMGNKRSKGPTAILAIRPLTWNFLVAGAGFEPATCGL